MSRLAIVDGDGAYWGTAGSEIGACRRIAVASDLPMTWRDVRELLHSGETVEVQVLGETVEFQVVPEGDLEAVDGR